MPTTVQSIFEFLDSVSWFFWLFFCFSAAGCMVPRAHQVSQSISLSLSLCYVRRSLECERVAFELALGLSPLPQPPSRNRREGAALLVNQRNLLLRKIVCACVCV